MIRMMSYPGAPRACWGIDPISIAAASLALSAIGTGASVMGQMNANAAQGAQAGYMRDIALQHRQVSEWQASDAVARGKIAEDAQRRKTGQMIGTQTAALAGQGTDFSGSEQDILGDTAAAGELDALTVRNNAAREAWGYKVQGVNAANSGALSAAKGFTSNLGAGASLLSGASSLGDKWWKFQQNNPGGSVTVGNPGLFGAGGPPT